MSARLSVLLALFVMGMNQAGLSADAGAPSFAPKTYGIDHYQQIWKRSPFIKETINTGPVASPLSAKYGLVGIATLNNLPVVFLLDRNETDPNKNRVMVSKAKVDAIHNIELVSVSMNKEPGKSTAIIKQGSEQASLVFDASALQPTGPSGGSVLPIPVPSAGYVPPPPSGVVPPPPSPGGITSQPGLNPATRIIRNPADQTPANQPPGLLNPANPAGQPPTAPVRRIIRPKTIDVN